VYETYKTPYGDISAWGSATQGFFWTDKHSFFGSKDDPFNYREISLGGQYRPFACCSLNVQGEYRDAGQSDNLGLRLSQAFADAAFHVGEDTLLGANLGRIEVPFALYNATRDRVDTRPSIVLPESIYLDGLGLRDYLLTGDGVLLYGLHRLSKESRIESKVAVAHSSFGHTAGLEDAILVSGWMDYVWDDKLRLRASMLRSAHEDTSLTYPVLSAQYLWDRWTFTGEYGRLQFDTPRGDLGTDGLYGQVEYAVSKDITLFGRYDYLRFHLDLPVPIQISEDRLRAQGLALGFGWDITKHVRLNGEYHLNNGTTWLNSRENPDLRMGGGERWNKFGVTISVRF
jgi:hypothetical protein